RINTGNRRGHPKPEEPADSSGDEAGQLRSRCWSARPEEDEAVALSKSDTPRPLARPPPPLPRPRSHSDLSDPHALGAASALLAFARPWPDARLQPPASFSLGSATPAPPAPLLPQLPGAAGVAASLPASPRPDKTPKLLARKRTMPFQRPLPLDAVR